MGQGRVDQITVPLALTDHDQRLQRLERNPVAAAAISPGITAWALANNVGYVVPPTIGAGYAGSDWIPLPFGYTSGIVDLGAVFTNAFNNGDADAIFSPNHANGDLYQLGYHIFSGHRSLTDWGFVSGDDVSSLRINAADYPGDYKVKARIAVLDDDTVGAAASQVIAVLPMVYGSADAGDTWSTAGGNFVLGWPRGDDGPTVPGSFPSTFVAGSLDFADTLVTDPGSSEYSLFQQITAQRDGIFGTDNDIVDLVLWAWNPGPSNVQIDFGVQMEKEDASTGMFTE